MSARKHPGKFIDQVVVITGASAGVGRATALAFAREGAKVALIARGEEGLQSARDEIENAGGAAVLTISADVADAQALDDAAERIERELGPIDIWVNNAMVTVFAPVAELTPEEFKRVTEVTYLGGVYGTMAALKRMRPRDHGTIVQVSSALAHRSIPLQSAYCGAKHALAGFIDALRCELIHERSNVHVTAVQMPALNTPQFSWARNKLPKRPQPVPPIFQPEVAADAILFAASHRRRDLPVGAPTWKAEWGQRFVPGLLDWYLGRTAYEGQQTDEPDDHDRADNLFAPVARDAATHGEFDRGARNSSWALWVEKHRAAIGTGLLIAGALGALGCARRPRKYTWGRS
ncbi:MAG TPA: SDR family oxidoreductase [Rhodanobacteraceae bacterium]|nr:SDR family oxidoreductase [Rhodanobacteraceae bacterium]